MNSCCGCRLIAGRIGADLAGDERAGLHCFDVGSRQPIFRMGNFGYAPRTQHGPVTARHGCKIK
ncbi:hypothetical protein ZHAS_00020062 [Anopheles sinensis]|uniref:Uncharacterized protein n=1 Tax=Anopheles sinensis TaxID=74873 RepID=A0A084WNV7_ANOSI|nr:hypothetical protein ZHAS_00020062 [Anopheles sinensis]